MDESKPQQTLIESTIGKRIWLMFLKGCLFLLSPGAYLAAGAQVYSDELDREDTKKLNAYAEYMRAYRAEQDAKHVKRYL